MLSHNDLSVFTDRRVLVAGVLVFALGWAAARAQPAPAPTPPERPVLTALARLAKAALWVLVVQQPPAEPQAAAVRAPASDLVNHMEGW